MASSKVRALRAVYSVLQNTALQELPAPERPGKGINGQVRMLELQEMLMIS